MNHFILETKSLIRDFYPDLQDVDVKVERDPLGVYVSKIHVRAKGKVFHAQKRDPNYRRCLEKCREAIESQIQKKRQRHLKDRHRIHNQLSLIA